MTQINTQPVGLLGLLGMKNGGRYPTAVSDSLATTFQLADLYQQQWIETDRDSTSFSASGFYTPFIVPPGEVWYIYQLSSRVVTAPGDNVSFGLTWMLNSSATGGSLTDFVQVGDVAAARAGACVVNNLGYFGAGTRFGAYIALFTSAGVIPQDCHVRYARLLA